MKKKPKPKWKAHATETVIVSKTSWTPEGGWTHEADDSHEKNALLSDKNTYAEWAKFWKELLQKHLKARGFSFYDDLPFRPYEDAERKAMIWPDERTEVAERRAYHAIVAMKFANAALAKGDTDAAMRKAFQAGIETGVAYSIFKSEGASGSKKIKAQKKRAEAMAAARLIFDGWRKPNRPTHDEIFDALPVRLRPGTSRTLRNWLTSEKWGKWTRPKPSYI